METSEDLRVNVGHGCGDTDPVASGFNSRALPGFQLSGTRSALAPPRAPALFRFRSAFIP